MWKSFLNFINNYPKSILLVYCILIKISILLIYNQVSLFPDSEGYLELSNKLGSGSLSGYNGERSPGYPFLLFIVNNNLNFVVYFQMILGLINSILVFKILKLLKFKTSFAFLISLFFSTLLHVVFYETSILTETFTLFLIHLITIVLIDDYFSNKLIYKDILVGLLLGTVVLTKPFYIFIPFIIYGFNVLKDFNFKGVISKRMVILLFPIIAFFGWSYVNKINTGYFVPTTYYGFNKAQVCVSFAEKAPAKYKKISEIYVKYRTLEIQNNGNISMTIWRAYDELLAKTGFTFLELSNELNNYSSATIKANPKDYLLQVGISFWDFWRTSICWNLENFKTTQYQNTFSFVWEMQHYVLRLFKILFLISIPITFITFLKDRIITTSVVLSTLILAASILQAAVVYGTNSRFSFPFEFLMLIVVFLTCSRFHLLKITE